MKQILRPFLILGLLTGLVGLAAAHSDNASVKAHVAIENDPALEAAAKAARRKAEQAERLEAQAQKRCEVAAKVINQKTANRVRQAQSQLRAFNNIADRIRAFAERRDITIADETALLQDMADKQAKVEADLDQLQDDADNFDCDGTNPKAALEAFIADSKLIRADLKAFREAVHKLKTGAQAALKARQTEQSGDES